MIVSPKLRLLVPITAVAFILGCGKSEEPKPVIPAKPATAAPAAPAAAAPAAQPTVTHAAAPVAPAASAKADGLIEKTKTLLASKNFTEAGVALKELAATELTPAQQKIVDGLKAQLKDYLAKDAAAEATKAAGSFLGK